MSKDWGDPSVNRRDSGKRLSPRELRIERLELTVALGGRSADRAQQELNELQNGGGDSNE